MIDDRSRASFQRARGVPQQLSSCHTAVIDGLVFEGHVPIADMKRLLAQRPRGVAGLAVSGMPIGSPGMEVPGQRSEEHTSELQSLMRISYAVFCLTKKKQNNRKHETT